MKTDIPILPPTVRWHALTNEGRNQEALELTAHLGHCFGGAYAGLSLKALGRSREALDSFIAATTREREVECTSGDDAVPFIQSVLFANALSGRATVAMQLNDRAEARLAVERFRGFWPHASTPPGPASSRRRGVAEGEPAALSGASAGVPSSASARAA